MTADTPPPFDETRRLAALHALALTGGGPSADFDAIATLAADMLGCPTALLNLIDRDRLIVKASHGADIAEMPRGEAMCDQTIRAPAPLIVDDLRDDARFAALPVVAAEGGARFYAGIPIHAVDGDGLHQPIGTLCVLDIVPRSLTAGGERALRHLAALAEALVAARKIAIEAIDLAAASEKLATELTRKERIFAQAERMAGIGSWRFALGDETLEWSEGVYRIYGLPSGTMPRLAAALEHYRPADRAVVTSALSDAIETGRPFDFEADFQTAQNESRRVRSIGEIELADGKPVALIGVFQDITARHALETMLRHSADTDALTGIGNRAAFDRTLRQAMASARRDGTPLILALADLDAFKSINDTFGHAAGDDVLRAVARALSVPSLGDAFAARIGGDEFALIVRQPAHVASVAALKDRLSEALRVEIRVDGLPLACGGTVGVAAFDSSYATVREFMRCADADLYASKRMRVGDRCRAA